MFKKFIFYVSLIVFAAIAWYIISPKWYFHHSKKYPYHSWKFNKVTGKAYLVEKSLKKVYRAKKLSLKELPKKSRKIEPNPFEGILDIKPNRFEGILNKKIKEQQVDNKDS